MKNPHIMIPSVFGWDWPSSVSETSPVTESMENIWLEGILGVCSIRLNRRSAWGLLRSSRSSASTCMNGIPERNGRHRVKQWNESGHRNAPLSIPNFQENSKYSKGEKKELCSYKVEKLKDDTPTQCPVCTWRKSKNNTISFNNVGNLKPTEKWSTLMYEGVVCCTIMVFLNESHIKHNEAVSTEARVYLKDFRWNTIEPLHENDGIGKPMTSLWSKCNWCCFQHY